MDKLRVGLLIDENCLPTEGGGYSYYQTLVKALNEFTFNQEIEIVNIVFSGKVDQRLFFSKPVIQVRKGIFTAIQYFLVELLYKFWFRTLRVSLESWGEYLSKRKAAIRNRNTVDYLKANDIDLVYYLKPEDYIMNYPMIITHWDVGHKSMYSFPEVASGGNYEKREAYYANVLNKAFLILCESNTGVTELLKYYNINPLKVKALPIFSGAIVNMVVPDVQQQEILKHFNLTAGQFYVYPAQFWAHKNHYNLVNAFHSLVKEPGCSQLKLVLCGADKGNMMYIRRLIHEPNLDNAVLLPGFVSNSELFTFYKHALSLVMPTFLGPTNIPLIEAAQLGCPVVCSSLEGHFELLETNAIYFDPSSADEIKQGMKKMLDPTFRKQLVDAAYQHIIESCFHVEKSIQVLQDILLQAKPIRKAWGAGKNMFKFLAYANIGVGSMSNGQW